MQLCCLRYRGRDGYHVAKGGRERDKDTTVELGRVDKRMEPVFGGEEREKSGEREKPGFGYLPVVTMFECSPVCQTAS